MFGARQTGKTTIIRNSLPEDAVVVDLSNPEIRSRHLSNPGEFIGICRAFPKTETPRHVFVDEVQTVPSIFDSVQHLFDGDKTRWRFILCGSSARKLRKSGTNLLPGRSILHRLYPLVMAELPAAEKFNSGIASPLPIKWSDDEPHPGRFPPCDLETRLAYGALPGIVTAAEEVRADLLRTYATVHLEEEIRRETLIRDIGAFLRFLEMAATESGNVVNYASISKESGVSMPTVKSYYQLLEDMFIGMHIPAYSGSKRKNVLSTPKFMFFDLGIRNAAAGLKISKDVVAANPGPLFEQWVGIELFNRIQYLGEGSLHYQRTRDGAEIDYIIEREGRLTPIEV
ncbi:MAG: AAA family ATPase, partial [Myxococcota bacterium]